VTPGSAPRATSGMHRRIWRWLGWRVTLHVPDGSYTKLRGQGLYCWRGGLVCDGMMERWNDERKGHPASRAFALSIIPSFLFSAQSFEQRLIASPTPPACARCRATSRRSRHGAHRAGSDPRLSARPATLVGSMPEQRVHDLSAAARYVEAWIITGPRATPSRLRWRSPARRRCRRSTATPATAT